MSETSSADLEMEINRRYRAAIILIAGKAILTVILTIIAVVFSGNLYRSGFENYTFYLWMVILITGISAFIVRRRRLAANNLRELKTLRGVAVLPAYLQNTVIIIATMGGAVALSGFIISILSSNYVDMIRAAMVAFVLLFIGFPHKNGWQRLVAGVKQNEYSSVSG